MRTDPSTGNVELLAQYTEATGTNIVWPRKRPSSRRRRRHSRRRRRHSRRRRRHSRRRRRHSRRRRRHSRRRRRHSRCGGSCIRTPAASSGKERQSNHACQNFVHDHNWLPSLLLRTEPNQVSRGGCTSPLQRRGFWEVTKTLACPGGRASLRGSLEHESKNHLVRRGAYH